MFGAHSQVTLVAPTASKMPWTCAPRPDVVLGAVAVDDRAGVVLPSPQGYHQPFISWLKRSMKGPPGLGVASPTADEGVVPAGGDVAQLKVGLVEALPSSHEPSSGPDSTRGAHVVEVRALERLHGAVHLPGLAPVDERHLLAGLLLEGVEGSAGQEGAGRRRPAVDERAEYSDAARAGVGAIASAASASTAPARRRNGGRRRRSSRRPPAPAGGPRRSDAGAVERQNTCFM